MPLSAHLLPSTWTIPCLYGIWCTQRIFPNLDWRRVSWNAVSWYLIVLSGGRAEVSLLLVAVSQRRCWSRVSSQRAAWDKLSTGSTRCPLSPSLLKGSWTWSCSFCDLFKQLTLWSPEAPQAWYMSSQDCEVDVCSQIHYWQKFTCLGGHRCAQPGRWQECLCTHQLMGKAAAHFPQEGEQLFYEQLSTIRDAKLLSLGCKGHQDSLCLLLTFIDSSTSHIIQTKAVVITADMNSYCLSMLMFPCLVSAQIL